MIDIFNLEPMAPVLDENMPASIGHNV